MNETHHDLVVLGGGSGGIAAAIRAARHGARVALVESGPLGGTCVNVGCVPKKAMWFAAQVAEAHALAPGYGFAVGALTLDWPRLVAAREAYVARSRAAYAQRLETLGIALHAGCGRLAAADAVETAAVRLRAPHVVIATGARPAVPAVPGAELGVDSDGFFAMRERPARVALIGSGYIAVELAGIFARLGSATTVFVRGDRLLGHFDPLLGEALAEAYAALGVSLRFGAVVDALEPEGRCVVARFADGSRAGPFDAVIWATGRRANADHIGLEAIGVARNAAGHVRVDERQNTSVPGVYAVGDVTDRPALTPVAIAAGRRLADRLFGGAADARLEDDLVPTVVFAHPPVGTVGLSEPAARARFGDAVQVHATQFVPMWFKVPGHGPATRMKLVCGGPDGRVVGLHAVGHGVDEMLQGFAVAMRLGATKADFDRTLAIHPTSAEEFVTMG